METAEEVAQTLGDIPFENFLRGMETRAEWLFLPGVSIFENFLRGMETKILGFIEIFENALKTSLEGWKLISRHKKRGPRRAFENFLRGMETPYCSAAAHRQQYFENFLRGMETLM